MESVTLDGIDRRLLHLVQEDASLSNKELAARVGLAPSSCHARLARLRGAGVIGTTHAVVEPKALGVGVEALVEVQLVRHSWEVVEAFRAHALSLPEVRAVFHLTGAHDFLVHVAVADPEHLRRIAMEGFTTRDEVGRIHTRLVYEHARKHVLPDLLP